MSRPTGGWHIRADEICLEDVLGVEKGRPRFLDVPADHRGEERFRARDGGRVGECR